MSEYLANALFIYEQEALFLTKKACANAHGCEVTSLPLAEFLATPAEHIQQHTLVAASLDGIMLKICSQLDKDFNIKLEVHYTL